MSCWFGHYPHLGFSSKWKLKSYHVNCLAFVEGWEERRIFRTHVCKGCGVHYSEIKKIDNATEAAILAEQKTKPQSAEVSE